MSAAPRTKDTPPPNDRNPATTRIRQLAFVLATLLAGPPDSPGVYTGPLGEETQTDAALQVDSYSYRSNVHISAGHHPSLQPTRHPRHRRRRDHRQIWRSAASQRPGLWP